MTTAGLDPSASGREPSRDAEDDLRDLAGGALVVLAGKAARLSRGAFLWVVTLLCGLEVMGLYSTAWAVCSVLNILARFGLQRGVVYRVTAARASGDRRRESAAVAAGLLLAAGAGIAVAAVAALTADRIAAFYDKPVAGALRIMAWTAPCLAVAWVLTSATRALRIMRYEVYVRSVAGPLILFAGGSAVGLAGLGLTAIAWVQLAMGAGILVLAAWYFRRHFSFLAAGRAVVRGPELRPMARFCLPVAFTDLLYALLAHLDVLMLAWYVDPAVVGVYVLARRVASIVLKAPQSFDAIFSPVVSDLSHRRREAALGDRFVTVARWILTVNLPIAACLLLLGDPVLRLLAAGGLDLAGLTLALRVLVVLCLGMTVQSVFAVAEPLLAMSGRPGLNTLNNGLWLALNFGLNLWLIDAWGAVGAALGAAASMLLINLIRIGQVYTVRGIQPFRRSLLKPLLAAAAASGPAGWLTAATDHALGGLAAAAAFLAVYGAVLAALGLEREDRVVLARARSRIGRRAGAP